MHGRQEEVDNRYDNNYAISDFIMQLSAIPIYKSCHISQHILLSLFVCDLKKKKPIPLCPKNDQEFIE